MAGRNQQTHAKRARELAVKEKRERKRLKKAQRAAGEDMPPSEDGEPTPDTEGEAESEAEWI